MSTVFDELLRDPSYSTRRPDLRFAHHLHPGDAGYKAMADAIDARLLCGAQ